VPGLEKLTQRFNEGAEAVFYMYWANEKEQITKIPIEGFDPHKHGCMRTIKCATPGRYILAMDADGTDDGEGGVTQAMLDMAYHVHENMGSKPLIKASGKKGLQLCWDYIFPEPRDEAWELLQLMMVAWTIYVELNLKQFGLEFGPPKKVDPPHFDTSMYQPSRKLRSFCTRFNKFFSVPIRYGDSLETVKKRMALRYSPLDYKIGTIIHSPSFITETPLPTWGGLDDKFDLEVEISNADISDNEIFSKLPPYLKKVVLYPGDLPHRQKCYLVWYLFRLGFGSQRALDFVWNNCKWEDLDNLSITTKQVESLKKFYNKVVAKSGMMHFPHYIFEDGEVYE